MFETCSSVIKQKVNAKAAEIRIPPLWCFNRLQRSISAYAPEQADQGIALDHNGNWDGDAHELIEGNNLPTSGIQ